MLLAGACLALVAGSAVFAATGRAQAHTAGRNLAAGRVRLAAARARGQAAGAALAVASFDRLAALGATGVTQSADTTTRDVLDREQQATAGLSSLATQVHGCVAGVQQAAAQVAGQNLPAAVSALTGSAGSCASAEGGGADGLAYPFDFPDPSVLRVGNLYYAYATNSAAGTVQVIQSTDLADWTVLGDALPHLPSWALPGATWAPAVFQLGATYFMYFSALYGFTGLQCIGVATSATPSGPFVGQGTSPLVCQTGLGGSTDPDPFIGLDGQPYLAWASVGSPGHTPDAPTLFIQQLGGDGTSTTGPGPIPVLGPSSPWEGGPKGVVEGPAMMVANGHYYLFYSGNDWRTANYGIGLADCTGPLGPCTRVGDGRLFATSAGLAGPGGPSVFNDPTGKIWVAFAAWSPAGVGPPNSRFLYIRDLQWVKGQPVIPAP